MSISFIWFNQWIENHYFEPKERESSIVCSHGSSDRYECVCFCLCFEGLIRSLVVHCPLIGWWYSSSGLYSSFHFQEFVYHQLTLCITLFDMVLNIHMLYNRMCFIFDKECLIDWISTTLFGLISRSISSTFSSDNIIVLLWADSRACSFALIAMLWRSLSRMMVCTPTLGLHFHISQY